MTMIERRPMQNDISPRFIDGDFLSQEIDEPLQYQSQEDNILEPIDDEALITPNNSVASFKHLGEQRRRAGLITKYEVTMQNDARYYLLHGTPKNPKTDVGITQTTPWITSLGGLNRRILHSQLDAGMYSSLLSIAQQAGYKPSLEQAAHNQLAIERFLAENLDHGRDPDNLIVKGISRGAMIGIAMGALAKKHDWEVMYSDLTVPCFPNKLDTFKTASKLPAMVRDEITSVANLRNIPLRALRHYIGTLDTSPAGIRYALATIPELTSGNAGKLADSIPEDASAYIVGFEGDVMSDMEEWHRRMEHHPNVIVETRPGGAHANCFHEDIYQESKQRMDELPWHINKAKANKETKLGRAAVEQLLASHAFADQYAA